MTTGVDTTMLARVLDGTVWHVGDGGYTVHFADYPTLSGFGETLMEAISQLLVVYHAVFLASVEERAAA